MIHHVSIPAREPERVARAIAELTGGTALPFKGAGGFMVATGDAAGTAIEVVADTLRLEPGEGDEQLRLRHREVLEGTQPFHLLLSVSMTREAVEALGARENWRTRHFWRGSQGRREFELIELWLENRLLVEVLTPEMVPTYVESLQRAIAPSSPTVTADATPTGSAGLRARRLS